jgi:hypothetical protein
MTWVIIAATALATLALILKLVVPFVASPAVLGSHGPFRAGLAGIAFLGAIAILGFFIADLDHIPLGTDPRPRFWEAAQLAGASAIFWLPVYLFAFSRARRNVPPVNDPASVQ